MHGDLGISWVNIVFDHLKLKPIPNLMVKVCMIIDIMQRSCPNAIRATSVHISVRAPGRGPGPAGQGGEGRRLAPGLPHCFSEGEEFWPPLPRPEGGWASTASQPCAPQGDGGHQHWTFERLDLECGEATLGTYR